MDNLFIVMPAYNEGENIEQVVKDWYQIVDKIGNGSKLVIINDGSKDNTFEILTKLKDKYPLLVPINKKNEGHGATVLRCYQYAIKNGADYIFQTDSDGQTVPDEFYTFWEGRKKCGLLIGNRNHRKDGFLRKLVTMVLRLVIFLEFHVWAKDANTPFRLMKASECKEAIKKIPKGFNLSNVILTVIYEKDNLGVEYIPITFRKRQGGVNSINIKKIIKIGKKAVVDFYKIRKTI